jgi:hypothetical protein
MTIGNPPRCIVCKNYILGVICKAYPDGIPQNIFNGAIIHDHSINGDHGFIFEPTEKAKEFFQLFPGR